MRILFASFALLAAFAVPAAHADIIDYTLTTSSHTITFSLDSHASGGIIGNGFIGYGNLTAKVDQTTVTDASLQFAAPGSAFATFGFVEDSLSFFFIDNSDNVFYTLNGGVPTLITGAFEMQNGSLSAVAVTPEPSSFLLLGTGVLGVAGAARRRFHA